LWCVGCTMAAVNRTAGMSLELKMLNQLGLSPCLEG
jgi:hypothetical protein